MNQPFPLAEKASKPVSFILPVVILLSVLSPLLLPAFITAVHAVVGRRRADEPVRTLAYQRIIAGLAVPAAA
jgi:hypothetical protein